MRSVPVTSAAAEGLRARNMAAARAQQSLADFMAGIVLAMELDPTRVVGFDDETSCLLLRDEEDQEGSEPITVRSS